MKTILLSALLLSATAAHAFNPQPDPPGFPLHGITNDQNARISVVNTGTTTCSVTMRIFDQDGDLLASRTVAIAPGDQGYLSVAGSDLVPAGSLRALVRPVVSRSDDPKATPPDPCKSSFMIRDMTTGATTFAESRLLPPDPTTPPDPNRATSPLVVPGTDQRAVLVYANTSLDPNGAACQATMVLRNPSGKVVASRSVSLAPGQASIIDVPGGNVALWGTITTNGFPPDPCMGTFELYNATNGATRVGAILR